MDLLENPFFVLSASPRDNRRRIMELAEEHSLLRDPDKCTVACSELTNPRKRLSAEVAWLLGIGPKRTEEILSLVESAPTDLFAVDSLPSIARANLLAAALVRLPKYNAEIFVDDPDRPRDRHSGLNNLSTDISNDYWWVNISFQYRKSYVVHRRKVCEFVNDVVEYILEIAGTFENIEPKKLCALINEERVVSGFPEVLDISVVETEIQERRRYYRKTIESVLDKLPPEELVKAVTDAVETATNNGENQAPILIDDIIDSYETKAQEFFEKENENIKIIISRLKKATDDNQPDSALATMVDQLIKVVKNWDVVAQPIQVSAMSRGLEHDESIRTAKSIRDLALYLYNIHDKPHLSLRLTKMLQEVFAEVGEVMDYVDEDVDKLDEITKKMAWSEPIIKLVDDGLNNIRKWPSLAYDEAQKVLNTAPELIAKMEAAKPDITVIHKYKDSIARLLMYCAIAYGNNTKKWKQCRDILDDALNKYAVSPDVVSEIQENLETAKNNSTNYHEQTVNNGVGKLATIIIPIIGVSLILLCNITKPKVDSDYKTSYNNYSNTEPDMFREKTIPPEYYNNQLKTGDSPYDGYFGKGIYDKKYYNELEVINGNETDVIVCLTEYKTKRTVRNEYIRAGETFTMTSVPNGTYFIKSFHGKHWNPDSTMFDDKIKGRFEANVSYSKSDKIEDLIVMAQDDKRYSHYAITLYKVKDGNMESKAISATDFFED